MRFPSLLLLWLLAFTVVRLPAALPVTLSPVEGRGGMVVAGHPEAAAAGLAVLRAGGNAIDAAVATSLAVGVAEPYGSGLGGKLMFLYHEARTGRTYAIDAMDAAGSVNVAAYLKRPAAARSYGYAEVCVPGLAAGLWTAHQRWGRLPWAATIDPAIRLARTGFEVLPKSREQFQEQERKLRRGDAEIARLYLPGGQLPAVGSRLPNEDLARTMELLARDGRDGFYRGSVAAALVRAAQAGGGWLSAEDLAGYEARVVEPLSVTIRGYTLFAGPPPTSGATLFLPILKALEVGGLAPTPLRSGGNLDLLGRHWRAALPDVLRTVGDVPASRFQVERLLAPDAIEGLRARAQPAPAKPARKVASARARQDDFPFAESAQAATTHFLVADREGNVVSATQSQSLHFGAGVVPSGTGVVMNNSMSNFATTDLRSPNYVAPGRRSRSTIGPTIAVRDGRVAFALGLPGSARIPTGLLQVLTDHLLLGRSLDEAIGDTRFHFQSAEGDGSDQLEAEASLPDVVAEQLRALGWKVVLREPAGTGRHFGGVNAIEVRPDGTLRGLADPRRTNAASGF
jgi:gamma-glutamyltranspeptidase/glutathione hydrolase